MSNPFEELPKQEVPKEVLPTDSISCFGYGSDEHGNYSSYTDGARNYYLYENGKIGVGDRHTYEPNLVDPDTEEGKALRAEAQRLAKLDDDIHEARRKYAQELAKGDPLLADVLTYAVEMSGGSHPAAQTIDGVSMYKVGGNSSHDALLGVKDGRLFLASSGSENYLLPESLEPGDNADTIMASAIYGLTDEWINHLSYEERARLLGIQYDYEAVPDFRIGSEQDIQLESIFEEKYGAMIREKLRPIVEAYLKSGSIPTESRVVTFKLDGDSHHVYVKRGIEDVTDVDKVYIGRCSVFQKSSAAAAARASEDELN